MAKRLPAAGKKLTPAQAKLVAKNVRREKQIAASNKMKTRSARMRADREAKMARSKRTKDLGSVWNWLGE